MSQVLLSLTLQTRKTKSKGDKCLGTVTDRKWLSWDSQGSMQLGPRVHALGHYDMLLANSGKRLNSCPLKT